MQLSELIHKQVTADRKRGFFSDLDSDLKQHDQLSKDLVGLIGEIGEFANVLKKVGLKLEHSKYEGPTLREARPLLREELADSLIYLLRLSAILDSDLENDVLQKMEANDTRYSHLG